MAYRPEYMEQVRLLLEVLPEFSKEKKFALKGGTAINLFVRNFPRISVDLDFCYVPVEDREASLTNMDLALQRVENQLKARHSNLHISSRKAAGGHIYQMLIQKGRVAVKVDLNHVLRGTIFPCTQADLCEKAQDEFRVFFETQILSLNDLYAGKLCAALDRQHPRDLFDVKLLLENEGFSNDLKLAFIVYLISHNRPIHELLDPHLNDFEDVFRNEFEGMVAQKVTYEELKNTRETLVKTIQQSLTSEDRQFLLLFKKMIPDWSLIKVNDAKNLPAVKWKMLNLRKMPKKKHEIQTKALEHVLF